MLLNGLSVLWPLMLYFSQLNLVPLVRQMVTVQNPKKSSLGKKPACSLVGKVSPGLWLPPSSPYSSGCLSPAGDGLQWAISVPSFVLCTVLAVSYVWAFRVVAIPQSGLVAQVSSFWLCMGCSCPILTKHCSPCLPCFPVLPPLPSGGCRRLRCFSAGGVTVGLVICWF